MARKQLRGIDFNTVTSKDLVSAFFENSEDPLEKTIEQIYVGKTAYATNDYVTISAGGYDDGILRFRYGKNKEPNFDIPQETKRNVNGTIIKLLEMLTQGLHYNWQQTIKPKNPPKYNRKGFISNSSKFFCYIYTEEIYDLITQLTPLFESIKCSASQAWKQPEIKAFMKDYNNKHKIPFKLTVFESEEGKSFQLNEIYKEIYLHCLN